MTSRELVECIRKLLGIEIYNLESNESWRNIAVLIDLYVQVKEAEIWRDECKIIAEAHQVYLQENRAAVFLDWLKRRLETAKSSLAIARVELEKIR